MSGGVRAGYLSPPLPPPPLAVIYPLWVSALSEAVPRGRVAPATDDHCLRGKKHPSPERRARPFSIFTCLFTPRACISFYSLASVLFMAASCSAGPRRRLIIDAGGERRREGRRIDGIKVDEEGREG